MATNFTNDPFDSFSDLRTVPFNEAGTGTIETQGIYVIGSGTVFKTELQRGAYIFNGSDEVRKVLFVDADDKAILDAPFTSNISPSTALDYIPAWKMNAKEISVLIPSTQEDGTTAYPWGLVNGKSFPNGTSLTLSKSSNPVSGSYDAVNPIIVDGSGTLFLVETTY